MDPSTTSPLTATAEHIGELRKDLYSIEANFSLLPAIQSGFKLNPGMRESVIAYIKTQEALMWLGKAIGTLGLGTNPYPQSSDPESTVIEPRVGQVEEKLPEDLGEVGNVKALRARLGNTELQIKSLRSEHTDNKNFQEALHTAHRYCQEAIMWLGLTLAMLKKGQEEKKGRDVGKEEGKAVWIGTKEKEKEKSSKKSHSKKRK